MPWHPGPFACPSCRAGRARTRAGDGADRVRTHSVVEDVSDGWETDAVSANGYVFRAAGRERRIAKRGAWPGGAAGVAAREGRGGAAAGRVRTYAIVEDVSDGWETDAVSANGCDFGLRVGRSAARGAARRRGGAAGRRGGGAAGRARPGRAAATEKGPGCRGIRAPSEHRAQPSRASTGPRAKKTTKPAATIHSSGLMRRARPDSAWISTQLTKPAPMPLAIE